ncbi:hypothetical protein MRX96_045678 [Rhipicephalus microplus]
MMAGNLGGRKDYHVQGRLVRKGNELWFDEDCKKPNCAWPQKLVCPTSDNCGCYCLQATKRCAEAWESECLAVCVGHSPCKCNCVGQFQPHQRNTYRNSTLQREFDCHPPPQIKRY